MTLTLNGEPRELHDGTTVAQLVDDVHAGDARRGVAVAVDSEVVPRSEWARTTLHDGAQVEILVAVAGG